MVHSNFEYSYCTIECIEKNLLPYYEYEIERNLETMIKN